MILVGLSILAAIGLLALIVWALHRDQRRKNEESVDRNLPLPPLELNQRDATQISSVEEILGISEAYTTRPAPPAPQTRASTAQPPERWLSGSRELLAEGKYNEALRQCRSALPQLKAFRQSCVVLRAQIRELKKKRRPYAVELEQLYRFAALADFFHGKAPNTNALPPSAVRQIDFAAWQSLSSPYAALGFDHLNLLTKTDTKWLLQEFGEPDSHGFMRELHCAQWNELRDSL